jgi:hypothetical protein
LRTYGYVPLTQAQTGVVGAPFGLLDPPDLAGYQVLHLVWERQGTSLVVQFYLTDDGLAAPSNAFTFWSFTDDEGTVWRFNRTEADVPAGTSFTWGAGLVRGWQWTVPNSALPAVSDSVQYVTTFDVLAEEDAQNTHLATELGLEVHDSAETDELTALHVLDPSFSQARGVIWVSPNEGIYAEGNDVFTPWTADEFPSDQAAEVTIANVSGEGGIGAGVRVTSAGAYAVVMDGTGVVRVNKYRSSGFQKTLATIIPSPPLESGDVLRIEAIGSTLTTMINGVVVHQTTDSDHASGTVAVTGFGSSSLLRAPPTSGSGWKGDNPRKNRVKFAVVPTGATQATTATSPILVLDFAVRPTSTQHEHYVTEPLLEPEVVVIVAPQSSEHAQEASSPVLVGGYAVIPASVEHGYSASGPIPTLNFDIGVADTEHGGQATELPYHSIVYPSPPEHTHDVTEPVLAIGNEIGATSVEHAHQVTSPEVVYSRKAVAPADAEHRHTVSTGLWEERRPIIYYEVEGMEERIRYFPVEEEDLITAVPGEEWLAVVAHETMLHVVVREQIRG